MTPKSIPVYLSTKFFQCTRFKWSVNAERNQYIWYFIYMHVCAYVHTNAWRAVYLRCNQCWHSIRGFASNHSHHHQHSHITAQTSKFWFLKKTQNLLMQCEFVYVFIELFALFSIHPSLFDDAVVIVDVFIRSLREIGIAKQAQRIRTHCVCVSFPIQQILFIG